jgi:hypothetical protein
MVIYNIYKDVLMKFISLIFVLLTVNVALPESDLDRLIPPEIKNDALYNAIYNLAKSENIKTILEIGSSGGAGSTDAFVKGAKENNNNPNIFCMELSKPRFAELQSCYKGLDFVKCYNVSSVPLEEFPTEKEVTDFFNNTRTNLDLYGIKTVIGWLKQDIDYVKSVDVPNNGIELIKEENGIGCFDMVLIDGSEFTGIAEYKLVYGAKFILLDDINAFKNHTNYNKLLNDSSYVLIEKNMDLRNGYAIFKCINVN